MSQIWIGAGLNQRRLSVNLGPVADLPLIRSAAPDSKAPMTDVVPTARDSTKSASSLPSRRKPKPSCPRTPLTLSCAPSLILIDRTPATLQAEARPFCTARTVNHSGPCRNRVLTRRRTTVTLTAVPHQPSGGLSRTPHTTSLAGSVVRTSHTPRIYRRPYPVRLGRRAIRTQGIYLIYREGGALRVSINTWIRTCSIRQSRQRHPLLPIRRAIPSSITRAVHHH